MLSVSHVETMNWHNAIRGARNPMNSWDKMDSDFAAYPDAREGEYVLGPNDLALCQRLCAAGSDHRKFVRQIFASIDITAPFYWWKEFDTYKVGTVANSCSTMHKVTAKEFVVADFSHEHLGEAGMQLLHNTIKLLNVYRKIYVDYDQPHDPPHKLPKKDYWWQIIQLLPTSYNQMRTISLNYEVLRNIYFARKDHKLDEWHSLCDVIVELPYFKEFFIDNPYLNKTV